MKQAAYTWDSQIDGMDYAFSYEKIKGKHTITVNGEPIVVKTGVVSSLIGFDEKFMLNGKEARLVIEKNKPDVVVNGVYLQSGKEYVQRPAWSMIFLVICILIPIVSLGGALPAILGFGGAAACVSVAKSSLPPIARVSLCIVISLAAWVLWFFMILGVNMLSA